MGSEIAAAAPGGIPLWYQAEQETLRLLELPPELLDMISSNSPPILELKSGISSSSSHAVLCTHNMTYSLRQVQTSNSVFLLRPHSVANSDVLEVKSDLCSFSSCTSTLELVVPSTSRDSKQKSVDETIVDLVPPYFSPNSTSHKSKAAVFSDAPFAREEIEAAWEGHCMFVLDARAFMPTPTVLVDTWTSILKAVHLLGLDLETTFDGELLWDSLDDPSIPRPLFEAVLRRLGAHGMVKTCKLDKDLIVTWTGRNVLEDSADGNKKGMWQVLDDWRKVVPEHWTNDITSEALIKLRVSDRELEQKLFNFAAELSARPTAKRTVGPNRDWHDRFDRTN